MLTLAVYLIPITCIIIITALSMRLKPNYVLILAFTLFAFGAVLRLFLSNAKDFDGLFYDLIAILIIFLGVESLIIAVLRRLLAK